MFSNLYIHKLKYNIFSKIVREKQRLEDTKKGTFRKTTFIKKAKQSLKIKESILRNKELDKRCLEKKYKKQKLED